MGIETAIIGSALIGGASSIMGANAQADAASSAAAAQVQANRENIDFQKWLYQDQKNMSKPWYQAGADALSSIQKGISDGSFDIGTFQVLDKYDPGALNPDVTDPGVWDFDSSKVQVDPGYDFRLKQGVNALDMSASSKGRLQSGAQQKAIAQYGQNLANQEYQDAYDREYQNQLGRFNSGVDQYGRQYSAQLSAYNASTNRANVLANLGLTAYNSGVAQKQNNYNILNNVVSGGQNAVSQSQNAANALSSQVGSSTINTGNAIANGHLNTGNAIASGYSGTATALNQGVSNALLYNYLKP